MAVTLRDVQKMIDPIRRRVRLLFTRSVVVTVNDAEGRQLLQVTGLPGEVLDGIERFQNYGFTSVPLEGAEAILGFVGGARSHGIASAVDDRRHRKKGMQRGEVAVYTDEGDSIHFKRGRIIKVTSGVEVDVEAPNIKLSGATEVLLEGGTIKLNGTGAVEISAAAITIDGSAVAIGSVTTVDGKLFLAHKHSGVQPGGADTGGVV